MTSKALNLPAIAPGSASVCVTVMPLFDPGEARVRFTVPHGRTIAEILAIAFPSASPSVLQRIRISLVRKAGFYAVDRQVWRLVRPNADVHVVIRVVPAGPAILPVLQLLTTVASQAVAGTIGTALGLSSFAQSILTFAIVTAGGLLLNSLFRPDTPNADKEKPTYAISGWRNQGVPDGVVPLVAGEVRYAPRYAASTWTEVVGDLIYIRSAFLWGYGPLAVTDLKIGETPLDKFDEVTVETQSGAPGDAALTLYPTQVIEESIGAELVMEPPLDDYGDPTEEPPEEKPVTRFTASDAAEACVIFYFQGGLFESDNEGGQSSKRVVIELAHRLVGAPDFDVVETLTFSEEKTKPFFRAYRWALPVRGRYEVQLTRKTKNDDDVGDQDDVKWFALQSFRPESPFNFAKVHAKSLVRVKATNQLNGTLDALNGVVSAKLRDWTGSAWVDATETKNPASFSLHALTGNHQAYPASDDEIDWPAFEDWHEHCTEVGLEYNRVHDFEGGLGEVLAASGAAGRAAVWHDGEKWTVTIDRPRTVVVAHINPRNASNFRWSTKYFEPPDAHRVTFLDETNDFLEGERLVPWPADIRYATKPLMDADLSPRNKTRAEVYADPTPGNNGYYRKSGAAGTGSWFPKPIDITEALDLPGKTSPREVWIETRRLQYERIYRNTVYTATQPGSVRVVAPGDAVMLSRDVLVRAMHSGRVVAVVGRRIEVDAVFMMEAGKAYGLRFRTYDDDSDSLGQSVLRTVSTVPGENKAVTLTGDGEIPSIGDLVHFGPVAQDSIPVIVASIERGNDNVSILQMLPAADEMHSRTAAEEPPAWNGRVGDNLGGSNAEPPAPVVTAVLSGLSGTGDPDGLLIRLRPRGDSPVILSGFEVRHRLGGAGAWETPVASPVSSGAVTIPGYASGDAIEWEPRAISIYGIPSSWGTTRTTTIGANDPPAPLSLVSFSIAGAGPRLGCAVCNLTTRNDAQVDTVRFYRKAVGAALNVLSDVPFDTLPVGQSESYSLIDGDETRASLLTDGDFSTGPGPYTIGSGWTIGAGKATKTAGTASSIRQPVAPTPGKTYRYQYEVSSRTAGTVRLRFEGTTLVASPIQSTNAIFRGSLVAAAGNNMFGVYGDASFAGSADDIILFEETATCAPQGVWDYFAVPFNSLGMPGPVSGPITVTIV